MLILIIFCLSREKKINLLSIIFNVFIILNYTFMYKLSYYLFFSMLLKQKTTKKRKENGISYLYTIKNLIN